jgi:hypothetical protein
LALLSERRRKSASVPVTILFGCVSFSSTVVCQLQEKLQSHFWC